MAIFLHFRAHRHRRILLQNAASCVRSYSSSDSDDSDKKSQSYFSDLKASLKHTPPSPQPTRRPSFYNYPNNLSKFRREPSVQPPRSSAKGISFQELYQPKSDTGSGSEYTFKSIKSMDPCHPVNPINSNALTTEFVPESEPQSVAQPSTPKKIVVKWTSEEEYALASAWVDASNDPFIIGNTQTRNIFWKRVREKFYGAMGRGEYRNPGVISSKWRSIRLHVTRFNDIYMQLYNNRQSDQSDHDIYVKACEAYKLQMGTRFLEGKTWTVLKQSSKWDLVPLMTTSCSKRSKTFKSSSQPASDACSEIDLNDTDGEIEFPDERTRPVDVERSMARNKGKQTSSSNDDNFQMNIDRLDSKLDRICEFKDDMQLILDMNCLVKKTDHLTGYDRVLVEQMKVKIRNKYRTKQ